VSTFLISFSQGPLHSQSHQHEDEDEEGWSRSSSASRAWVVDEWIPIRNNVKKIGTSLISSYVSSVVVVVVVEEEYGQKCRHKRK
jgi:hypothetical protein